VVDRGRSFGPVGSVVRVGDIRRGHLSYVLDILQRCYMLVSGPNAFTSAAPRFGTFLVDCRKCQRFVD